MNVSNEDMLTPCELCEKTFSKSNYRCCDCDYSNIRNCYEGECVYCFDNKCILNLKFCGYADVIYKEKI